MVDDKKDLETGSAVADITKSDQVAAASKQELVKALGGKRFACVHSARKKVFLAMSRQEAKAILDAMLAEIKKVLVAPYEAEVRGLEILIKKAEKDVTDPN